MLQRQQRALLLHLLDAPHATPSAQPNAPNGFTAAAAAATTIQCEQPHDSAGAPEPPSSCISSPPSPPTLPCDLTAKTRQSQPIHVAVLIIGLVSVNLADLGEEHRLIHLAAVLACLVLLAQVTLAARASTRLGCILLTAHGGVQLVCSFVSSISGHEKLLAKGASLGTAGIATGYGAVGVWLGSHHQEVLSMREKVGTASVLGTANAVPRAQAALNQLIGVDFPPGPHCVPWYVIINLQWEVRTTVLSQLMSFLFVLGPYWIAACLLISGIAPEPSHLRCCAAMIVYAVGVVLMVVADLYKHVTLRHKRGLVTDGPFALVRHPTYAGEMMVYGGFALMVPHWAPWALLAFVWTHFANR
ncbi:hypothetical protein EMIHUDRAFT_226089 [Emiliania huxleyi CCMP1516]|uniref:Steroid 5-alpha reductase C-terminal domain-containing protein n=2 Tax=Emiliania huxleyi TaxID=2903 RepID=A0A0D3KLG3_EMIH1|nr:hypothetical protein EMIHUDRAFT_226089 [Emiliania huxleyi CCMP1516]EOD36598.1 hypothetical protein EMIHUDRAFT_226089 [Emiliania huxleyi CCMP1516]|eukprot:XP_005789027.1 hypothetical protein EMIHUDRAFT_226089 [Emiliania huxleyi CCMP1516]